MKAYILRRDGVEVARGNEFDLLAYIHRTHSFSFDYALKYAGYSVREVTA